MLITNESTGISFNVRLVRRGDKYGQNNCLTHDNDAPMVEFYDARYPYSEFGQFVTRYYTSTLIRRGSPARGIQLDGGSPDWSITADNERDVLTMLAIV